MADQDNLKTYVRETRTTESSGGNMALIVGGLVVAVGFILWLVFAGPMPVSTTTTTEPAASTTTDTTNVTIEPPAAPADPTTNVTIDGTEPAPADDAAPADTGVAPADTGTAPADATEEAPANP
jgi:hypothetical protein